MTGIRGPRARRDGFRRVDLIAGRPLCGDAQEEFGHRDGREMEPRTQIILGLVFREDVKGLMALLPDEGWCGFHALTFLFGFLNIASLIKPHK